jgi:hypothetical protein
LSRHKGANSSQRSLKVERPEACRCVIVTRMSRANVDLFDAAGVDRNLPVRIAGPQYRCAAGGTEVMSPDDVSPRIGRQADSLSFQFHGPRWHFPVQEPVTPARRAIALNEPDKLCVDLEPDGSAVARKLVWAFTRGRATHSRRFHRRTVAIDGCGIRGPW